MSNQWFRMYHEFATDPKVQMLSEVNQRRFVMLLCLRCCNGDVTLHDEEVAFQLRISNDEWMQTKSILVSKNLINDESKPIAWDKRQYISDSSAARVAKHRALKKKTCNVTVTPPDTDTDTETEKNNYIVELFDFWKTTLNHEKAKIDTKRTKAIKNALKLGYSIDDLKSAIIGCSKTPHNMGQNDRGEKYDSIDLIFRDADHIDRFIRNAGQQIGAQKPANDPLSRYKVIGGGL